MNYSPKAAPASKRRGVDLTQGPVGRHLLNLGTFLALGVVAVMCTSLVDLYFISRLGANSLAALGFTFPIVLTVMSLSMGLGNGIVAVVARAVGQADHEAMGALGTDALMLGLLIALLLSVIGYVTIEPLFAFLGASQDVLPLIKQYMHIWFLGTTFQIVPQLCQNIIRAHGDTRTPSLILWASSAANVVLDPILIFGWGPIPAFGLKGAAFANILSRVIYCLGVLWVLNFRLHSLAPISFTASRLNRSWGKLLHIGLPATAAQMVMPVSAAIVTKVIAMSGTLAVAAYGVGSRIEMVTAIYLWAVGGALPPFVGQNAGAGHMDRVRTSVNIATKFVLFFGVAMVAVTMLEGNEIVGFFTTSAEVGNLAVYYLRVVSLSYALSGLVLIASQTMNALARPMPAAVISLARTVGVTVPFALMGQWLGQVHGVFIGVALAGAVCGAGAWILMSMIVAQESRRHEAVDSSVLAGA